MEVLGDLHYYVINNKIYNPCRFKGDIALNANVVLTFSEAMSIGTGNVTLTGNGATETIAVGSAQVTGAGTSTITINPANDFVAGVNYSIVIPATAFDDAAGNSYAGTTITVTSFLPAPNEQSKCCQNHSIPNQHSR